MAWLAKPQSPKEADTYPRLRQGQRILLIGDELSVRIVFNNLVGRNFQPREKEEGERLVAWRKLQEISEEYRNYLGFMEADLGITINPDDLSVEIREKEDQEV